MFKKLAIVDENLPKAVDGVLKSLGWQVFAVRGSHLRGKSDRMIISFAQKSKAVLFSGDWGFANILDFPPQNYFGIVILDFPNEVSVDLIARETKKALSKISLADFKNKLIIVELGKIRIRSGL